MSAIDGPLGRSQKYDHGHPHRYAAGCRCRPCKDGYNQAAQREGALKLQTLGFVFHGTCKTYNRGCRCDECKAAHKARMARNRAARQADV
jgi:hypothetical protein